MAAPNLIWLARHHFITLQMEHFIHARDVRHGRAKGYFTDQIKFTMFGLPFAVGGLIALLRSSRFRLIERVLHWAVFAAGDCEGQGVLPDAGVPGAVCGWCGGAGGLAGDSGEGCARVGVRSGGGGGACWKRVRLPGRICRYGGRDRRRGTGR